MGDIIYLDRIPVRIRAGAVVCPVAAVPSYLAAEIFFDGLHRNDVTWSVILPQEYRGLQPANWTAEQLTAMRLLRESNVSHYLINMEGQPFDIGLFSAKRPFAAALP